MNAWAGQYDCNFLCVCVLGDQSAYPLAKEMSQEAQLTKAVNGFINNDADMPNYGQLGCKGFIILDAEHRVVADRTPAFMQVRGIAFDHVEAILDALCAKQPVPSILPGDNIVLQQPPDSHQQLKGSLGICVKLCGGTMEFGFMDGPLKGRVLGGVPMGGVTKFDAESQGRNNGDVDRGSCGPAAQGKCGPDGCGPPGKCGPGGCDDKGGCDGSGTIDQAFVDSALSLPSVKVPSMDAEHAECAVAFRSLASERSRTALEEVLKHLQEHFEHEEALFVQHNFGVHANENLSAQKSHKDDHTRILDSIRSRLGASGDFVPVDFIQGLLQHFNEHTTRFDLMYAEPLSAKGAK